MRALLILLVLLASGPVRAADADAREAARAIIVRQFEALAKDDAAAAYALAAPAIQGMFPTADVFIGMVRTNYRAVYRHRSFAFGTVRDQGEAGLSQDVAIQDEFGVDWTAEYILERQADGGWRITGCRLAKAPGTSL